MWLRRRLTVLAWRPMMGVLGVGNGVGRKASLQRTHEEEPQSGRLRHHRSYRQLTFVQQMGLPLADMFRTELIGRLTKMFREPLDCTDVRAYSF